MDDTDRPTDEPTVEIRLPEGLFRQLHANAVERGFDSNVEYLTCLVQGDYGRLIQHEVAGKYDAEIEEGLASGEPLPLDIEAMREEFRARKAAREAARQRATAS